MNYTIVLLPLIVLVWTLIHVLSAISYSRKSKTTALPPGPYPFPIIGSLHKLGSHPHQSLANLSKTYGPIMTLKLGSITTIVTSSPKVAKEFLRKEDQAFSNRRVPYASHALDHSHDSIFWLPTGNKWKNLRKICKEQIFAAQRLEASQGLRKKAIEQLVDYVQKCCISNEAVDIGSVTFTTSLNALSNFFFSTDFDSYYSSSSREFMDTISAVLEIYGKPNLADYFPLLKPVDPQGVRRKADVIIEKYLGVFDRIIDQRLAEIKDSSPNICSTSNDILDSLLNICQNQKNDWELSSFSLKHFLADLFVAGTDTNSSTVEWAMAELLRSPEKMAKARSELAQVIGKDGQVQESDISKLPYLQAVIKETLRLHPPAPFVIRRKCEADVETQGFLVPENAQVLLNLWGSGRDSVVWSDAESFVPERFLDSKTDYKGQHCQLIPFGAGKRICPGLPLAHKMMHLMLGSLLYAFDWKLEGEMKPQDLDMTEKFGLTLRKAASLRATPVMFAT